MHVLRNFRVFRLCLQGSSCVDDSPNIFTSVLFFFLSAELLDTGSRCHFHLQCAQCTVFNSTVEQNSIQMTTCLLQLYHTATINGTHESWKQNAPYHTVLRWKNHKFSVKRHSPSPDPSPSPPTAPRFSRLRRSTCDPPIFQWRWRRCTCH